MLRKAWAERLHRIEQRGWPLLEADQLYRPGCYPHLGMAPVTGALSTRSSARVRDQVEEAEHRRGNEHFRATGLTKMVPALANEMGSVYLSLVERYPSVRLDRVNFAASAEEFPGDEGDLGYFDGQSSDVLPLRHAADALGEDSISRVLTNLHRIDGRVARRARATYERMALPPRDARNLLNDGALFLTECFAHPTCYAVVASHSEYRVDHGFERYPGRAVHASAVSVASETLIHEFGHAVDQALHLQGTESWTRAIESLERCVLRRPDGRWLIPAAALRERGLTRDDVRLAAYTQRRGQPRVRGEARPGTREAVREVVGPILQEALGYYGRHSLVEAFAEAFQLSLVARDPKVRRRLRPFRETLIELGVERRRRRPL